MKKAYLLFICMTMSIILFSQNNSRINIVGKATDTLSVPLNYASVLLLDPKDTSLISYTHTGTDGRYEFKNLKAKKYLVKVTYVGFIPVFAIADGTDGKDINLATLKLKEIASELMEVVIKAAKAPISIRGDTIEYDASTFKVPPGSTVEDLLRKLPGIEVDADGSIKSQGQNVTKVTVDGKRFFGSDPKAATKNLPAEGITKVQVYNQETEETKLTGTSSTQPEKAMNLQLKDEFKKGGFGKVVAGAGTDDRRELKGNYNKFNDREQFSLVGVGNNTGRNGLSWDDYQDFKGSQSFNWDNGEDFGFGSGGDKYIVYGGDGGDSQEDAGITGSVFGGSSGGYPENYNGGVNYNYDHKKTQLSALYYYDQKGLKSEVLRNEQFFTNDRSYLKNDQTDNERTSYNHRAEFRLEQKLDSLNTLVLNSNIFISKLNSSSIGSLLYKRLDQTKSNESTFDNSLDSKVINWRSSAVYRKKFKKKGRSFGLSSTYSLNNGDKTGYQQSENYFYDVEGIQDSLSTINQINKTTSNRSQVTANAMYIEPVTKKLFWESFYNFSKRLESADRYVNDVKLNNETQNDFLSRFYDNSIMLNRVGSSIRYSSNGTNVSIGAAWQTYDITGNYESGPSAGIKGDITRKFTNWIPNFNFSEALKGNKYLSASYSVYAQEPSVNNLQPIIDNSNPLYIKVGNPDLIPQIQHEASINYNMFNAINFTNLYFNINYSYYQNQFIQELTVDSLNATTTKPINYTGGQNIGTYAGYGFPIIKNKFTINFSYSYNLGNSFSFVNAIRNKTITNSHYPGFRINITPGEIYSIYANAYFGFSDTKYDVNTNLNQSIFTQNYSLELNTLTVWGIYINSKFSYSRTSNDQFGTAVDIPILNASIYKVFLKNNRGELRISVYDIFNKSQNIYQTASVNAITETRFNTLRRYGMLSFTYNLRGVNVEIKKKRGMW